MSAVDRKPEKLTDTQSGERVKSEEYQNQAEAETMVIEDEIKVEPGPVKLEQVKKDETVEPSLVQVEEPLWVDVKPPKVEGDEQGTCIDVKPTCVGESMQMDGDEKLDQTVTKDDRVEPNLFKTEDLTEPVLNETKPSCVADIHDTMEVEEEDEKPFENRTQINAEQTIPRGRQESSDIENMSEDREQTAARASPPAFANEEPALPQEASRENTPDNRLATPRSITPQQLNVKEEPIDVDIDLSLTSKDRASPNKRRRLFMDAVELTPRSQRELSSEEINQMIQGMQNPAAKKKKDDMTLSLDTIKDRLKRINYHVYDVDLEKTVQETTVTRKFMSQHYGGNTQEMHPVIKKATIERTGLKNFLYPNLEYNPYCPEMPGRPGFIFHVGTTGYSDDEESDDEERHDEEESNEQAEEGKDDAGSDEEDGKQKGTDGKVRVKRKGGEEEEEVILISRLDTNHWLYQGQYVEIDSPALSVQEWKQQSPKVKKTWIEGILDMQWGQSLRVDVGLRKRLGRQPTKAERKNALRNPAKYESKVTVDDISRALNRGELAIYPGIMKCVGYNVELQQFIVDNFVREPKPPKTEKNKTPKKPSAKGKRAPATGAKRKRDQESESEDEQPVYKSRGTRSRPIVV